MYQQKKVLPTDPKWCAPRISADEIQKYVGRSVTLIGDASVAGADGSIEFQCIVSGQRFKVQNVNSSDLVTRNELQIFVDPSGNFYLESSTQLDDDFDAEAYKQLIGLIRNHHSSLFYC